MKTQDSQNKQINIQKQKEHLWIIKKKKVCTQMSIAVLFIINKNQKKSESPLFGEWINKTQYVYTKEQ